MKPDRWTLAVIGPLALWLVWAALTVQVEPYDGLDTIINARMVVDGDTSQFVLNRNVGMALALAPAEWLHGLMGLSRLDARPHHLAMFVLHLAYLATVWGALRRRAQDPKQAALAFVAAVPTFLFFTYGPFISHDIFPGAMLLAMVLLAHRHIEHGFEPRPFATLVALGAAAALVKHTYALFWFMVLAATLCSRPKPARWLGLCGAAGLSGALTYAAIAWVLRGHVQLEGPWFLGPFEQVEVIAGIAGALPFPIWLYGRNLAAFGVAAVVLAGVGLFAALPKRGVDRTIAVAWLLAILALHAISAREVRYLAFTAPLTAWLALNGLERLGTPRARLGVAVGVAVTVLVPLNLPAEAFRISQSFYQTHPAEALLEPLTAKPPGRRSMVAAGLNNLTFAPPTDSPLAADPYHRLFHVGPFQIRRLYDLDAEDLIIAASLADVQHWPVEATLVASNLGWLTNATSWVGEPLPGRAELRQLVASDVYIQLETLPSDLVIEAPKLSPSVAAELRTADAVIAMVESPPGVFRPKNPPSTMPMAGTLHSLVIDEVYVLPE